MKKLTITLLSFLVCICLGTSCQTPAAEPEPTPTPTPEPEPEPEPEPTPTPSKDSIYALFCIPSAEEDGIARAFPGAEGGGRFATGGRGGKVIHVTNLNDSGTGSLRAAIKQTGARTIVFDVAGIIELQSALKVEANCGDLTIAGQTAPGDGICLKNYNFRINASNVIVRYIRSRMGDEKKTEDDAMNIYCDSGLENIIIDHCSMSWSTDECGSFYGVQGFTLQWCTLCESLRNSIHDKGTHGYGGIWGGSNATFHHNLLAHHDSRNPRFDHDYVSTLKGPLDFIDNVVYNWGGNSAYGAESCNDSGDYKKYNFINNFFKPGPATNSSKQRFIDPTTSCSNCTKKMGTALIVPGHFYMTGNVMFGNDEMTNDNWKGTTASASLINEIKATAPFQWDAKPAVLTIHTAKTARDRVLSYAGASLSRDAVDTRVCNETNKGTYTYEGSNGSSKGFIDTQTDVGGWPSYSASAEQLAAVKDSDGDGMSDAFETKFGLDPADPADGLTKTLDKNSRYTNFEMYLHYLVKDITKAQNEGGTYGQIQ